MAAGAANASAWRPGLEAARPRRSPAFGVRGAHGLQTVRAPERDPQPAAEPRWPRCELERSGSRLAGRGSGLANLESGVTPCPWGPPPGAGGPKGPAPRTAGGPARILQQTGLGLSLEKTGSRKEGSGPVSRLPAAARGLEGAPSALPRPAPPPPSCGNSESPCPCSLLQGRSSVVSPTQMVPCRALQLHLQRPFSFK